VIGDKSRKRSQMAYRCLADRAKDFETL